MAEMMDRRALGVLRGTPELIIDGAYLAHFGRIPGSISCLRTNLQNLAEVSRSHPTLD